MGFPKLTSEQMRRIEDALATSEEKNEKAQRSLLIILALSRGLPQSQVAADVGISPQAVSSQGKKFAEAPESFIDRQLSRLPKRKGVKGGKRPVGRPGLLSTKDWSSTIEKQQYTAVDIAILTLTKGESVFGLVFRKSRDLFESLVPQTSADQPVYRSSLLVRTGEWPTLAVLDSDLKAISETALQLYESLSELTRKIEPLQNLRDSYSANDHFYLIRFGDPRCTQTIVSDLLGVSSERAYVQDTKSSAEWFRAVDDILFHLRHRNSFPGLFPSAHSLLSSLRSFPRGDAEYRWVGGDYGLSDHLRVSVMASYYHLAYGVMVDLAPALWEKLGRYKTAPIFGENRIRPKIAVKTAAYGPALVVESLPALSRSHPVPPPSDEDPARSVRRRLACLKPFTTFFYTNPMIADAPRPLVFCPQKTQQADPANSTVACVPLFRNTVVKGFEYPADYLLNVSGKARAGVTSFIPKVGEEPILRLVDRQFLRDLSSAVKSYSHLHALWDIWAGAQTEIQDIADGYHFPPQHDPEEWHMWEFAPDQMDPKLLLSLKKIRSLPGQDFMRYGRNPSGLSSIEILFAWLDADFLIWGLKDSARARLRALAERWCKAVHTVIASEFYSNGRLKAQEVSRASWYIPGGSTSDIEAELPGWINEILEVFTRGNHRVIRGAIELAQLRHSPRQRPVLVWMEPYSNILRRWRRFLRLSLRRKAQSFRRYASRHVPMDEALIGISAEEYELPETLNILEGAVAALASDEAVSALAIEVRELERHEWKQVVGHYQSEGLDREGLTGLFQMWHSLSEGGVGMKGPPSREEIESVRVTLRAIKLPTRRKPGTSGMGS